MKTTDIAIPLPCTVDWQKMTPRDGGRFCGDCKKVVRDLSKLTEADARALLATPPREGLCVRYLADKHGTVFFAGMQTSSLVPATLLSRAKRAAATAAMGGAMFAVQACTALQGSDSADRTDQELIPNMGGVAADPDKMGLDAGADDASPDATTHDSDADAGADSSAEASASDAGSDAHEGPK
jgi:hypothetical protein